MGDGKGVFPVANSTLPYWRTELHDIDSHRSTERLPEECDVLIIGAGLSGVSTAHNILENNASPPSIVLLEAREVFSGATGRNGGHLMMVWSYIDSIRKQYGEEAAKELALFQAAQVYAMKQIVLKEKLDCDFLLTRVCETFIDQDQADEMTSIYKKLLDDGIDYIEDVQCIGTKYAEKLSGIKNAKVSFTTAAAQLWPYKFVASLVARLLETTTINVQTHTPVTSISDNTDGSSLVHTSRGSILAKKIVFATNAYTAGISPTYTSTIVPVKLTCSHITTPFNTAHPAPHLTQTYGLSSGTHPAYHDYLIPRPDGGVICGGAKETYLEDKKLWWNNYDDSTLIEPARKHFSTVMQDNLVGWENSGAFADYMWTGSKFISNT